MGEISDNAVVAVLFSSGSLDSMWTDHSGYGNNIESNSPDFEDPAVVMTGHNLHILHDDSMNMGTDSFWVSLFTQPTDIDYPRSAYIMKKGSGMYYGTDRTGWTPGFELGHGFQSRGIACTVRDVESTTEGAEKCRANLYFDDGVTWADIMHDWSHVAVVFDRTAGDYGEVRMYLNGVPQLQNVMTLTEDCDASWNNENGFDLGGLYGWQTYGYLKEFQMVAGLPTLNEIRAAGGFEPLDDCSEDPVIDNLDGENSMCEESMAGTQCQLACMTGYTLSHSDPVTCLGYWDPLPDCVADPCPALEIDHIFVNATCEGTNSSTSCIFGCDAGYSPSAEANCFAGAWDDVSCDADCTFDPVIADLDGDNSPCENTPSGTTCAFACLGGATPSDVATCTDGAWDSQTCVPMDGSSANSDGSMMMFSAAPTESLTLAAVAGIILARTFFR